MRIRRSASRLLGSGVSPVSDPALPGFELTPPPPPPAHESHASFVAASGTLEHCELSLSPWDLMDQLDLSDPQKRKRAADVGEGFYYYTGFAPSRSTKRQRSMLEEPTLPAQDKEVPQHQLTDVTPMSSCSHGVPEPPPAGGKEEAPPDPAGHIGLTKPQAQTDGADHQAAPPVHLDEPMSDDGTAGIAGYDEESSDDYVVKSRKIKSKSPLKKRWRKPVKARSLKSLLY